MRSAFGQSQFKELHQAALCTALGVPLGPSMRCQTLIDLFPPHKHCQGKQREYTGPAQMNMGCGSRPVAFHRWVGEEVTRNTGGERGQEDPIDFRHSCITVGALLAQAKTKSSCPVIKVPCSRRALGEWSVM